VKESSKIIAALFLAYMVTMGAQFFLGPQGVLARQDLEAYQETLDENLKDLENIQAQLKVRFDQLKSNRRVLSLEARDLGLFRPGEGVMRLIGLKKNLPFSFEGNILRGSAGGGMNHGVFRLTGIISALVFYFLITIGNLVYLSSKVQEGAKAEAVKKAPVYQYF
jgi:cell division protein FtsB